MRRGTLAAIGLGLGLAGLAVAPAIASPPSSPTPGNGAQHSGLSPNSGSNGNNCQQGDGTGPNGWSMLNKTGSPANTGATMLEGEVHLIGATPNTAYMIELAGPNNSNCMTVGMLTTNGQGIGNGHIPSMANSPVTGGPGTYYVVLTTGGSEAYASGAMTVN